MSQNCAFCMIKRGDIASEFMYEDDRLFVIRDINPVAPVHLLIIPKQHMTILSEKASNEEMILGQMLSVAKEMATLVGLSESGFRIVINQGPDSGQEVVHLHMHLIGGRRLSSMC